MKYAFTNATLFDAKSYKSVKEEMTVLVDGTKIVGVYDKKVKLPSGYKKYDLKGKFLMPGLIDLCAHIHGRSRPAFDNVIPGAVAKLLSASMGAIGKSSAENLARENLQNALLSGVTTVRMAGDLTYTDVKLRRLVREGAFLAPDIITSGPAITCTLGHGEGTFAVSSDSPDELSIYVDAHAARDSDIIKICVSGRDKGSLSSRTMTAEQIHAICKRASLLGYRVFAHCDSAESIKLALSEGVSVIEHGSLMDASLASAMKEKGASLIISLSPQFPLVKLPTSETGLTPSAKDSCASVMKNVISGARKAISERIPVGIGSSSTLPFVPPYSMYREIYLFSKYCGIPSEYALYTATAVNARIAGIYDRVGSIEVGKDADLLILAKDPIKNLRALRSPFAVMKGGKLIEKPCIKRIPDIDAMLDRIM